MSVTRIMTTTAEAAATRYGLLLDGWRALYSRALDEPRFGAPVQLRRIAEDAYAIARRYLEAESGEIGAAFTDIAQRALVSTHEEINDTDSAEFTDAISEHVSAFVEHLTNELTIQIERDIALLKKTLQNTILVVNVAASAQRLPLKTALIQHRIAGNTDVKFGFTDRRSARWPAQRYIRTIWRHALLNLYNDVVVMELADAGIDTAEVRHEDPRSDIHGSVVSLVANTQLPTYDDIRDQTFHPNADAVLARSA